MKILHTADWHIRDKDINEAEKCLNHILTLTRQEKPDLIIHAGDIFDSRNVRLDSMAAKLAFRIFSELADMAPVCSVLGTPSHEGEATEALQFINAKYPIWVAKRPEQIYLLDGRFHDKFLGNDPDAILSLIPQPTKQHFNTDSDIKNADAEIANAMSAIFAGFGAKAVEYDAPHIVVYHGTIRGATLSNDQIMVGKDVEISKDQFGLSNADIVLCGHIHLPQEISPNIFYSGSLYAMNFGEIHKHGFYIHELLEN